MKKCLAFLLALALMLACACAEETPVEELLPLADAAAADALRKESDARYCGIRPMATDWSEDGDAVRLLGDVYLAVDQLEQLTHEQYAQVQWLDQRAVVELRKAQDGWQVSSFALDAEWEMEQAAQDYFSTTMVEYFAGDFSVQYPALFGEDSVVFTDRGVSGKIEGASFLAEKTENTQKLTTDAILAAKKQETNDGITNIDEYTGVGQLRTTVDGQCLVYMVLATQDSIYQAELRYDESLIKDFMLYGDYMLNSFSVSEAGNG